MINLNLRRCSGVNFKYKGIITGFWCMTENY